MSATLGSTAPTQSVNDVMADIASDSIRQTLVESSPTPDTPRDAQGKFAKPEGNKSATPDAAAYQSDATDPSKSATTEQEPVVLPEGMVAVPSITRELATAFTVADGEGAIEPPDLTIEFTANGKTRREPLDKVVKLAQWGVYNHERQQQAETIAQHNETLQQQLAQYDAALRQATAERMQLLSNDEAYLTARARFEQQNTPEMRLQAEREQLQLERTQMQFQQAQDIGTQFLDTKVEPALELIAGALPSVSKEELAARVLLVANKFTVQTPFGSIINPNAHGQIAAAIRDEVVPWAQQLHDHRASANAGADTKTQALQVEAQKAKNLAARSMKTVGNVGSARKAAPPIKTLDDAINASVQAALESVGTR